MKCLRVLNVSSTSELHMVIIVSYTTVTNIVINGN